MIRLGRSFAWGKVVPGASCARREAPGGGLATGKADSHQNAGAEV